MDTDTTLRLVGLAGDAIYPTGIALLFIGGRSGWADRLSGSIISEATAEKISKMLCVSRISTTITALQGDTPPPDETLVVIATADGGRLRNRCGTEPIR